MVDTIVRLTTVMSPLLIALVSGVWVLYKHFSHRKSKDDENGSQLTLVQGQPVEWTWQDEVKALQKRLDASAARETAFREHLVRLGVDPRSVLSEMKLLQTPKKRVPTSSAIEGSIVVLTEDSPKDRSVNTTDPTPDPTQDEGT